MVRVKPRYNPDVNQWWLCDEGRYGLGWIDQERLQAVQGPSAYGTGTPTWNQALETISTALTGIPGERIGVIASAQLTNEELYLIREIFQRRLGAQVCASVPVESGSSDDFLIKADKNPNTMGARLLGISAPEAPDAGQILDLAIAGNLDALWVTGHDLVELFGDEKVAQLREKVGLVVFSGTNQNRTSEMAHWVLPAAAYVEKDGTFVNCDGHVQRVGRAFPPIGDSREEWRIFLELATLLNLGLDWQKPEEIFTDVAAGETPFRGLSYESIGNQGARVRPTESAEEVSVP